jgi:plasmid stabilization system protein ParE
MNYKIILKNNAKLDLNESIKWYNSQKKGLGNIFYTQIKTEINKLKEFPYIGENKHLAIRTIVVKKFPYMIHYYIDDQKKNIVILAVLHTSRNTDKYPNI